VKESAMGDAANTLAVAPISVNVCRFAVAE